MRKLRNWGYLALMVTALMMGCPAPTDDGFGGGGGGGGGGPDTTPPNFSTSYPNVSSVGQTQVTVTVMLNENGKVYAGVLADNATAPTSAELKNNSIAFLAHDSNLSVIANTSTSINLTGLTANTDYDLYVVAEDVANNLQVAPVKLDIKTSPLGWDVGPNVTATKSGFNLSATLSASYTVYYIVVATGAAAPDENQIKAGVNYSSVTVLSKGSFGPSTSITGKDLDINPGTSYDVYFVLDNGTPILGSIAKRSITTLASTPVRLLRLAPIYGTGYSYGDPKAWLDIEILDASQLASLGNWKVRFYRATAINDLFTASSVTWTLANNDVIRIHEIGGRTTDSIKTDNNADKWDYATTSAYFLGSDKSVVWIENDSGQVLDMIIYRTSSITSTWFDTGTDTAINNAVNAGDWPSNQLADTFIFSNNKTDILQLKSGRIEGNLKTHWEEVTPPGLGLVPAATPNSVYNSSVGTIKLTVAVTEAGGASVTGVVVDLSSLGGPFASMTNQTMYDDGTNGDITANDKTFSYDLVIPSGHPVNAYSLAVTATGTPSITKTTVINLNVSTPVLADFESGPAGSEAGGITAATANTTPSPAGGNYLTLTGTTVGSNTNIYTSTLNLGPKASFTKITFWIKGTAAKGLVVRLGTSGSNYYNINDDNIAGPHNITGSPVYAGKTVNVSTWTKVTLNLGALDPTGLQFIFRGGSTAAYNLEIDHIQYE